MSAAAEEHTHDWVELGTDSHQVKGAIHPGVEYRCDCGAYARKITAFMCGPRIKAEPLTADNCLILADKNARAEASA